MSRSCVDRSSCYISPYHVTEYRLNDIRCRNSFEDRVSAVVVFVDAVNFRVKKVKQSLYRPGQALRFPLG